MRRITSPRARLFCVCARNRSMRAIARRRVVELSWWLQESKRRFQWAILPIPRSQKQLSISISGCSANQNADSVSLPRAPHEAKNNLLSQSPDTPRIKMQIPFRYLGNPTKPKTTFCLNLQILRESKCRFRFVTSGIPRSQKQPSVSISGHSANQKTDSVSLPRTFHEAKNNSLSRSLDTPRIKKQISFRYLGHPTKPKTTFCLNLRTLHELKNRFRFVTSGAPRSQKQPSVSISRYSANQKTDFVSLPRTFHEVENNFLS